MGPVELRPPCRRRRRVLHVLPTPDHGLATEAPHGVNRDPVAVSRRSVDRVLARATWFRLRRDHGRGSASRGRRVSAAVQGGAERDAFGVLLGRNDGRLGSVSRRRRTHRLPRCERLLLGGRVPRRRAVVHGDPQARRRLTCVAGRARRILYGDERREGRDLAQPWPHAAETYRRRFHERRHG